MKLGITMPIHNKDDIEFVTKFPCILGTPCSILIWQGSAIYNKKDMYYNISPYVLQKNNTITRPPLHANNSVLNITSPLTKNGKNVIVENFGKFLSRPHVYIRPESPLSILILFKILL